MPRTIEDQLNEILNECEEELGNEAERAFKEVGVDTSQNLKSTSPRQSGDYATGWTYSKKGKGLNSSVRIYNKKKPGLTHLLENGHMILVNGRNYGRSRAIKHIEPAEKKATQELIERLSEL